MRPHVAEPAMPRPGKAVVALLVLNVALYVAELVGLRAGLPIDELFFLVPQKVLEEGWVWQLLSYVMLHSPVSAGHLVMNMLMLWMFGSALERSWGTPRFLGAYAVSALAGGALTLAVALISKMTGILPHFWTSPHVGASGAILGITIAWATVYADRPMSFLFMGQMSGRTFALVLVGIELLFALSLDGTSSTSHFGGMAGGFFFARRLWSGEGWRSLFRRGRLARQRRRLEHELRVIEGGKGKKPPDDLPN